MQSTAAQVMTLGQSAVALTGPWKFEPGDSPWVDGKPLWAEPGYDDSEWATMSMAPKAGSFDVQLGTTGYVPGWTHRGYPNLSGYAWYRLRLNVGNTGRPLWLKMPNDFDDAYQIYVNGHYVGQFGRFSAKHVTLYYSKPVSFALPTPGPNGEIEVALRFYMSAATRFQAPDAGGMHQPPVLGLSSTVHLLEAAEHTAMLHIYLGTVLESFLFLLVAPLALLAWLKSRREQVYLWLFLALLWEVLNNFLTVFALLSFAMTMAADTLIRYVIVDPLGLTLWTMFWWYWFGLRQQRWIPGVAWLLAAARMLVLFCALSPSMGLSILSQPWLHGFNTATAWCVAAEGVLLAVILVEGFRRDSTEALLAALPILFVEFSSFSIYLLAFGIPNTLYPFGLGIRVTSISGFLMIMVIGALALRRFLHTQVREGLARQAIEQDLEHAQQLQQRVLVPEAVESRCFTVEAEYRPARMVGGDFFQTLTKPDGSLLVVIGDVSGKGVSASMLVAVLVGAIRNRAEDSFDPVSMLVRLNRRLIGRSGGHFATCLAAEISPDGTMRIANAGHLPPYLNGREMELEGSLPLGIVDEGEYPVQTFHLKPGDRLTFMTDGVVEATNQADELLGFERTREISVQSAVAIVEEAQRFGQEDDITVLAVAFTGP